MAKLLGHDIVTTAELDDVKMEIATAHQTTLDLLEQDMDALERRVSKAQLIAVIFGIIGTVMVFGAVLLSLHH